MAADWRKEIDEAVDQRFDRLVALRRELHTHPELSGEETATSLLLYQLLGDEGFQVEMGPDGRGVLADYGHGSKCMALRADIDALRIHDAKTVSYRSQHDGVMHACGHDAHTALVFGALTSLKDVAESQAVPWPLKFRGVFQPAEEICTGACEMIEGGALEGVDAILATHMDPLRDVGRIGIRTGVLTANCDEVILQITGRGGHAARPHETSDPIAAAAQLINALYVQIPRRTDSQEAVVVTIGQIVGGDSCNVIPESVTLRGTVRTLCSEVRERTFEHMRRLAIGIGGTTDTSVQVLEGMSAKAVNNDRQLISLLRYATRDVLGEEGLEGIPRASMGSEDFAFYLEHVPGAMIRVGCRSEKVNGGPLHNPNFDVDEEAIRLGAKILARATVYWADPDRQPDDSNLAANI